MIFNKMTRLRGYGRYACLGASVLEALGRKYKMHNLQKGRIDYLAQTMQMSAAVCRPEKVVPHLTRDYIAPTIEQQLSLCPTFRPQLVYMDSFSELSDQRFRHRKDGWTFCSNYLDLRHDDEFANTFESLGLLDLTDLHERYTRLIQIVRQRWGDIPIVYLHFPSDLETRDKFVSRAAEIRRIVEACAQVTPRLYSFSVSPSIVRPPDTVEPGMEDFPYHYSQETYLAFAGMIKRNPVLNRLF